MCCPRSSASTGWSPRAGATAASSRSSSWSAPRGCRDERLLIGIGQDVTERLRAQAELRQSEQRFRAVFDHAPIAMIVVDLDRTIVDANAAMGELLGVPARELPGRSAAELVDPATDLQPLGELLAGTDGYRQEQELLRKDGTSVWVSAAVSVVRDADGNPVHAVAMMEDITERKQVERLKDEFVSVVGHELRTPLTSIRGSLGLLDGGLAGDIDDEAREMVKMALDNTNRLVRLVEDTLDFERLTAGVEELGCAPGAGARARRRGGARRRAPVRRGGPPAAQGGRGPPGSCRS